VSVNSEAQDNPVRTRTKFFVMKEGQIAFAGTREQLEQQTDPYIRRFVRH
jgi:ABC-type transporter Mla maintaining outer membrane lipid asymmetry ATPase subunit MlaF